MYIRQRDFLRYTKRERERKRECSSVESSKKALFCGDCCDRNEAVILVVLVLISLIFIYESALVFVVDKRRNSKF